MTWAGFAWVRGHRQENLPKPNHFQLLWPIQISVIPAKERKKKKKAFFKIKLLSSDREAVAPAHTLFTHSTELAFLQELGRAQSCWFKDIWNKNSENEGFCSFLASCFFPWPTLPAHAKRLSTVQGHLCREAPSFLASWKTTVSTAPKKKRLVESGGGWETDRDKGLGISKVIQSYLSHSTHTGAFCRQDFRQDPGASIADFQRHLLTSNTPGKKSIGKMPESVAVCT